MAKKYLFGFDIGTSESKGTICDQDGNVIATAASAHTAPPDRMLPGFGWGTIVTPSPTRVITQRIRAIQRLFAVNCSLPCMRLLLLDTDIQFILVFFRVSVNVGRFLPLVGNGSGKLMP